MNEQEVKDRAYAMPITNPAYPRPPIPYGQKTQHQLWEYRTTQPPNFQKQI